MNMSRIARAGASLLATAAVAATLLVPAGPANAQQSHPGVVGEHPVSWTPHVRNGIVNALTLVGDTVVVGGNFTVVQDSDRTVTLERRFLFAFSRDDGQVRQFTAELDGPVQALAPGPDGTVYVGGTFRHVNGVAQRGVTQLRLDGGERVADFDAAINWGAVSAMARHGNDLYLGGTFTAVNGVARPGLARLDLATGEVDRSFDAQLTNRTGHRINVQDLALSPAGDRLVAVGGFTHSHGWLRPQLVMLDTASSPAQLADWYTDAYQPRCAPGFHTYLRGVAFSPDGSYFAVVTTGGVADPDRMCNTAARFEATGTGMHRPTWVNHTGGNSLYSVEITGPAVYVGGHQQWMDNPHGNKSPGPGAVEREGIAAIDPDGGKALPWNPGRARGVGVQDFLATVEGLFVGSDTTRLGGVSRDRIGMFPLSEHAPAPPVPGPEPDPEPEPEPDPDPHPDPSQPGPPERGGWSWFQLGWLVDFLLRR